MAQRQLPISKSKTKTFETLVTAHVFLDATVLTKIKCSRLIPSVFFKGV